MADAMARAVIRNALFFGSVKWTSLIVPRATYTSPELAQVGFHSEELKAMGKQFDTYTAFMKDNDRGICEGEIEGFARFFTEKGSDKILGCVIVCSRAGEMISEVSLAMKHKVGLSGFN